MQDYFYHYFHNKVRSKNKEGAKKSKKDKKVIYKVLKHFKDIKSKSQLSEWLPRIQEELKSYHLEYPIA
jgi:ABC-type bacteriocin/lantibiotic exporter with double-glycine peptidase domain